MEDELEPMEDEPERMEDARMDDERGRMDERACMDERVCMDDGRVGRRCASAAGFSPPTPSAPRSVSPSETDASVLRTRSISR